MIDSHHTISDDEAGVFFLVEPVVLCGSQQHIAEMRLGQAGLMRGTCGTGGLWVNDQWRIFFPYLPRWDSNLHSIHICNISVDVGTDLDGGEGPGLQLFSLEPLLGIRDFLMRIRIRGSVPLLMDPDPVPDPTPNPTPFFSDFKDAKKKISSYFFSYTLPVPAGT